MSLSPDAQQASSLALALMTSALNTTQYLTVAATTVLVWDMIVTLDIEIQRVWLARKTFGTSLFFFNRYVPLLVQLYDVYYEFLPAPSLQFCKRFELSYAILSLLSVASIACVLILRTNALYRSKPVFFVLASLGILSIANMVACFLIVFNLTNFTPEKPLGFTGCYSQCTSSICQTVLTIFWIPFFFFETLVFSLTIRKYMQEYRRMQFPNHSIVLAVLMRDGLVYYVVIIAICIFNVLMWVFNPLQSFFAIALWKSLQSTICSRMLLNLQGLLEATTSGLAASTFSSSASDSQPGTLLHLTSFRSSMDVGEGLEDEYLNDQEDQDLCMTGLGG